MDNERNNEIMNEEELSNILTLTDADGNELEFEFIDIIDFEGGEYVILMPVEDFDDDVVILKIEPLNEEEDSYVGVEDERVLNAVFAIFKEKYKDVFNFVD
jgi:uncharacterized protein YrzB (UPF0473 family)